MTKSKYLVQMLAIGLLAAWSGSQANAAYVSYAINPGGLETFNITWDNTTENALAGGIDLQRTGGSTAMPADYVTVCTDIGGTLYLGYSYGYSAPQVFSGQSGVNPTWGAGNQNGLSDQANAAAAIQAAADIYFQHKNVLTTGTTSEKAALQLAVWAALYDTTAGSTLNGISGRFQVNSGDASAISLATTWLSQVNLNDNYTGYLLIPDPTAQYGLPGQELFYNVTPVPEATTLIAGALLLLPFGASTLRILRKNRTVA
jgi:hypothetical protein